MSASTRHRFPADRHPEPVQAAWFRLAPVPLAPRRGRHLVRQVLESDGHCPWCGKPFQPHYTAVLAEALEVVEGAGNTLRAARQDLP